MRCDEACQTGMCEGVQEESATAAASVALILALVAHPISVGVGKRGMPPKEGGAPKLRAGGGPKAKTKDKAQEEDPEDGGAAAAAARAVADESRRLVDVAVTRGVRVLQPEWPQHA